MIQCCVARILCGCMLLRNDDMLPQSLCMILMHKSQYQGVLLSFQHLHISLAAGRLGQPDDIAQAALFLADPDKSGFITGQTLVVDGGVTCKLVYPE